MSLVTSLAEVWIEIASEVVQLLEDIVTSLAEVWIEIKEVGHNQGGECVTSLAEVWIEISLRVNSSLEPLGHFPCGSVD